MLNLWRKGLTKPQRPGFKVNEQRAMTALISNYLDFQYYIDISDISTNSQETVYCNWLRVRYVLGRSSHDHEQVLPYGSVHACTPIQEEHAAAWPIISLEVTTIHVDIQWLIYIYSRI